MVSFVSLSATHTHITTTSHMPKATIQSTYQPLLSSTHDIPNSGFHSILGSVSAAGKTKYLAGGSGITVLSTFEGVAWNASPFSGMLATYGHAQMSSSSGMTAYPLDELGPTFASVLPMFITVLAILKFHDDQIRGSTNGRQIAA